MPFEAVGDDGETGEAGTPRVLSSSILSVRKVSTSRAFTTFSRLRCDGGEVTRYDGLSSILLANKCEPLGRVRGGEVIELWEDEDLVRRDFGDCSDGDEERPLVCDVER